MGRKLQQWWAAMEADTTALCCTDVCRRRRQSLPGAGDIVWGEAVGRMNGSRTGPRCMLNAGVVTTYPTAREAWAVDCAMAKRAARQTFSVHLTEGRGGGVPAGICWCSLTLSHLGATSSEGTPESTLKQMCRGTMDEQVTCGQARFCLNWQDQRLNMALLALFLPHSV